MRDLDELGEIDSLRQVSQTSPKCFLHDDHRWVLPIISSAQESGDLPRPCTIVMFDAHHDSFDPECLSEIEQIREAGCSYNQLIGLCRDHLLKIDNDWLRAGMQLGLIDHAAIFGVEDRRDAQKFKEFKDSKGNVHKIEMAALPGVELEYQGGLCDMASHGNRTLWDILGWRIEPGVGFGFQSKSPRILLDFDLDCFVIRWNRFHTYNFPWPDEVFEKEFLAPTYEEGWSGKTFVANLIARAGLVTIAREPGFCGGEEKCNAVLAKVNRYLFDEKLSI